MASWTTITLLNLATYIEQGVLNVANTSDLAPGQADRFTTAMNDVTAEIRDKLEGIQGVVISGTANSIPAGLKGRACQLILVAMQAAYPGLGLTKDQLEQFRDAQKFVDTLGTKDNNYRPGLPPDPQVNNVQTSPKAAVIRSTPRAITEGSMSGLTLGVGRGARDCSSGHNNLI